VENWADDFRVDPDETLAGLLSYYADTARQTEQVVAEVADLGQPQATDIIRETLDGRTAGPLTEDYDAQG